jgi:hypothetical protein
VTGCSAKTSPTSAEHAQFEVVGTPVDVFDAPRIRLRDPTLREYDVNIRQHAQVGGREYRGEAHAFESGKGKAVCGSNDARASQICRCEEWVSEEGVVDGKVTQGRDGEEAWQA